MVFWILAVLALFVVQTLIGPLMRVALYDAPTKKRAKFALGPRDKPLPSPAITERADRALKNMFEALPVFLALALLLMVEGRAGGISQTGAMVFFFCRLLYVAAYMSGIPAIRSILWGVSWVGLGMMVVALLG